MTSESSPALVSLPSAPGAASLRCFRAGLKAFPTLRVDWDAFSAGWERFSGALSEGERGVVDEFLRIACLLNVAGAAIVLDREYLQPLRPVIQRYCGAEDPLDEVMQRLREKLLVGETPKLAQYNNRGHFRAWLRVVAVRTAQDSARSQGGRNMDQELTERLECLTTGPEASLIRGEFQALLRECLMEAVAELPQRERYALRMHFVGGWNVTQIGQVLSAHRATAARWIVSAKQRLDVSVRQALSRRMELLPTEVEQLLGVFSSQLELRVSQIFETQHGTAADAGTRSS